MEAEESRSVAAVTQVSVRLVLSSAGFGRTLFVSIVSPVWSLGRSKLVVFIGLSSVSVAVETPMWFHFGSLLKWSRSVEPDEPGISNLTGAAKARLAC